ncbi:aldolase [Actinomadura sp. WMMA1423]|uniref:Cgl0159 family (beta/alpha)8-fold protein n=1 Tax=Actinomadura sp. WMMA1423 TaxID=2591108 RepID=UPI001F0D0355|nr:aldolase [Actinomadura sp. WMMA1423]
MTPEMPAPSADARAERIAGLAEARAVRPESIAEAAGRRARRGSLLGGTGRLMLLAADHPARGALAAGGDPLAMADRGELLDRLCTALERPGVDGVMGTADVIEDLLLLGVLDGKVVIGSMNRGGLAGSSFEIDDRFTAYGAGAIAASGLDGGKMLLRVDEADPATARALEGCARAVSELAEHGLMAMVEPFISHRVDGRVRNDLSPEAMTRAIAIASGLGTTSARTWLKVPVVQDMERVMAASTLPALLLGGEVAADPAAAREGWRRALRLPTVRGLVIGRSLLYPADGDVAAAVDAAVELL